MYIHLWIFYLLPGLSNSLQKLVESKNRIWAKSQHSKKENRRFLGAINIPSLKPISYLPSTFLGIPRSLIQATHTIPPIWLDFRPIWWPTSPCPVILYLCLTMAQRQWCVNKKKHVDPEASDPSPNVLRNKGNHCFDMLITYLEHTIWEFYAKSMFIWINSKILG